MAEDTPVSYRNLVIYETSVRNHGPNGTFVDVEADIERIRALGVDLIWFMPIYPIGQLNKKGRLGSPYSVRDHRAVNPEYGTTSDFAQLIERAHALRMKVMLDVVFTHTARDSPLIEQHPEWYHQDANGVLFSTTLPDWTDIIDLKHSNAELSAYLIETVQQWAAFGADGFRCDVASFLPVQFWLDARRAVADVKPGVIWLAESAHASYVASRRDAGLSILSDSELYRAFDLTYDQDILPAWQAAVMGKVSVTRYVEMLRFQDCIYPANFVKMRFVENHDQPRIMRLAPSRARALAWTAFQAFNKGAFLIQAGQESAALQTPSLFDIDKVSWGRYELQPFLATLARLKKDPALVEGKFIILRGDPAIQAVWRHHGCSLYGVFNVSGVRSNLRVSLPNGEYNDVLTGDTVVIRQGRIPAPKSAAIVRCDSQQDWRPLYSGLLDYHAEAAYEREESSAKQEE